MTPRLIALLAFTLVITACGTEDSVGTTAPQILSGTIHVTGGFAGIDEIWSLATDRTITGPAGETGTMSDADLAAVREAIAAADFFGLDAEYLPDDICCDRFTYVLTLTDGDHTNTVATIDAAEAPQTLFALIDRFRTALREAASIG